MVAPRLLALAGVLAAVVVAIDTRQRLRDTPAPERRRHTAGRLGGASLVLALVGFDGTFGIVRDTGLPATVASGLEAALLLAALAGLCVAWWLPLPDDGDADDS